MSRSSTITTDENIQAVEQIVMRDWQISARRLACEESEVNSDNYFHCIVTNDETWLYYYDPLSQQEAR